MLALIGHSLGLGGCDGRLVIAYSPRNHMTSLATPQLVAERTFKTRRHHRSWQEVRLSSDDQERGPADIAVTGQHCTFSLEGLSWLRRSAACVDHGDVGTNVVPRARCRVAYTSSGRLGHRLLLVCCIRGSESSRSVLRFHDGLDNCSVGVCLKNNEPLVDDERHASHSTWSFEAIASRWLCGTSSSGDTVEKTNSGQLIASVVESWLISVAVVQGLVISDLASIIKPACHAVVWSALLFAKYAVTGASDCR
ncbi:hypothetical protein Ae201684_003226 [Aphanomyces euteiches]|uniref:Uncharacterized protein n=1 Tax=Aphanomyces euteiches TaxID=100861 RepID=A0A6G0XMD5_9STRA|nr:hypothetical protein Ae201684_003226 [Aphanomyces euteiches]